MKKRILAAMLTAVAVSMAACGSSDSGSTSTTTAALATEAAAEADAEEPEAVEAGETTAASVEDASSAENYLEGKRITLLLKSYTHMFWVESANEATMLAEQYGCDLEILAPTVANSNEEQIELLENSLVNPPDLYIIVPADSSGIAPAIEEINSEGIPIINVNTQITGEGAEYDSFVSCNQYDLGYTTVSAGIEKLGEEGNAVIIFGKPGAETYVQRGQGAEAAFAEHEGWTVLDNQVANGDRNEAMTVMSTLLTKYDNIDMVYAEDGEMALGAAEALKQAGKEGEIKIIAQNSSSEICDAIKSGSIYMTYDDAAWAQTELGFAVANLVLGGQEVEDTYYSEIYLVDSDNVAEYAQRYE
ncbi:MAG: sugar ABC transporter substrate-binding protein [Clostridiales bacterium]|nr:sugar ABC transporter substrate-binding protein [Clostridiales bacterium]